MKKLLLLLVLSPLFAVAQKDYKVVFDLTSKDTNDHRAVIRWVNEILKAEPTAMVEVVMFAQGLSMVKKERSTVANDIALLSGNKNVKFAVCAVAMQNQGLTLGELLPSIQTVPDGIYEIISKQRQGWGYIKAKL